MAGVIEFTPLPPKEAIKFFKRKTVGARFTYDWRDMWQAEHAAAFVVAKAMRADILKVIYEGLERALKDGQTVREFAKQVRPLLEEKGWWGFQKVFDPVTGKRILAELGTPRRLNTIYDVNLRMARAAGRWERIERQAKTRPYLMYVDAGGERVRTAHRRWGRPPIILPVDHPFWKTHYPPNGWRCRCIVRQVSLRTLERLGLKVSTESEIKLAGWGKTKTWKNKRTGKTVKVPVGIDAGFGYNVGQARLRALTPTPDGGPIGGRSGSVKYVSGGGHLPLLPPRTTSSKRILNDNISQEGAIAAFLKEFDGPVFFDPAQSPLLISRRLFVRDDGRYKNDKRIRRTHVLIMADTIKDPDEIWVEFVEVNGVMKLKRRAYARWALPNNDVSGLAVFEEQDDGVWRGATLFPVGRTSSTSQINYILKNIRVGTLVYRREE